MTLIREWHLSLTYNIVHYSNIYIYNIQPPLLSVNILSRSGDIPGMIRGITMKLDAPLSCLFLGVINTKAISKGIETEHHHG